jgi:hypothetical protein
LQRRKSSAATAVWPPIYRGDKTYAICGEALPYFARGDDEASNGRRQGMSAS